MTASPPDPAAAISVEQANPAFYRAFEKKDLNALTQVCSQSVASLCIHPGREALKGWQSIEQSWQQIFKATRYLEIDIDIQIIEANYRGCRRLSLRCPSRKCHAGQRQASSISPVNGH